MIPHTHHVCQEYTLASDMGTGDMLLLSHCNYTLAGRNNSIRWLARVVTLTSPSTSFIDFSGLFVLSPLLIRRPFSSALLIRGTDETGLHASPHPEWILI